jgi:hypothetical protein
LSAVNSCRYYIPGLLKSSHALLIFPFLRKFHLNLFPALFRKSKSVAVISSDGELNIMQIKEDRLVLKSQVRVLLDPYPEFRLIEWNNTETLLFSTRSSAVMDVFEATGMFLYKIPMVCFLNTPN